MTRRKRRRQAARLPKGAYRLPTGGYITESIGHADTRGRRIRVRAIHRDEIDAKKVADALIAIILEHPERFK